MYYELAKTHAKAHASSYKQKHNGLDDGGVVVKEYGVDKAHWGKILELYKRLYATVHTTSPIVFVNDKYIGGYDKFVTSYSKI
jgi:glutaredoxin